jgi:hypothetical protein
MDFVWKFEFFKTRKNSYIRPLWITDSEYGGHMDFVQKFEIF